MRQALLATAALPLMLAVSACNDGCPKGQHSEVTGWTWMPVTHFTSNGKNTTSYVTLDYVPQYGCVADKGNS